MSFTVFYFFHVFNCRWYKHISSYSNEVNSLPGVIKSLEQLGFGSDSGKEKSKKVENDEDDDDFDLFGSDEEEDAEAQRIKEERLKVDFSI